MIRRQAQRNGRNTRLSPCAGAIGALEYSAS